MYYVENVKGMWRLLIELTVKRGVIMLSAACFGDSQELKEGSIP